MVGNQLWNSAGHRIGREMRRIKSVAGSEHIAACYRHSETYEASDEARLISG